MNKLLISLIVFFVWNTALAEGSQTEAAFALDAMRLVDQQMLFIENFKRELGDDIDLQSIEEKIRSKFILIYAETYTTEELEGIKVFFKSNAGKAIIEKRIELNEKVKQAWLELYLELSNEG